MDLAPLLRAFRLTMPAAAGVVLASPDGRALAADVPDAEAVALEAGGSWGQGESVLVPRPSGPVLVVRLPGDSSLLPAGPIGRP
ncbi:MAG TPA: hypothetical protein VNX21_07885 [Candidatus Thermoplasmatota archaeon]|nr:hypothetical protein [Candidatus Thermoplasmatota archaeon]